jgi:hypothetical protein
MTNRFNDRPFSEPLLKTSKGCIYQYTTTYKGVVGGGKNLQTSVGTKAIDDQLRHRLPPRMIWPMNLLTNKGCKLGGSLLSSQLNLVLESISQVTCHLLWTDRIQISSCCSCLHLAFSPSLLPTGLTWDVRDGGSSYIRSSQAEVGQERSK